MKFVLVDDQGQIAGPPSVSSKELKQIVESLYSSMESIYIEKGEFVRCLSDLESLIGSTGLVSDDLSLGRLTRTQTAELHNRLNNLSSEAKERIQRDPSVQDLFVQLGMLCSFAVERELSLWLVSE